ncbi:MAG TPA: HupE/UreJ family protein [Burkholderiales bacterium]|nr:HupE/UreJ family protein [Burkholderiales bacterium]
MSASVFRSIVAFLVVCSFPVIAYAHPGHSHDANALAGFIHPLLGVDHLLAMLAIGAWAAQSEGRRVWLAPSLFVGFLGIGAVLGVQQMSLPGVEMGIALSVLIAGLLLAGVHPRRSAIAYVLVAAFAILHGHAHGVEGPAQGALAPYFAGFMVATLFLHLAGFWIGRQLRHWSRHAVQASGVAVGAMGCWLLMQQLV